MFEEIIGHARARRILTASLKREAVAHAYLFYGEQGIGKQTTARQFGKGLLCTASCGSHSAGEPRPEDCPSCRKMDRQVHPDWMEIRPEGSVIKIGQIRALVDGIFLPPLLGRRKVFLIDDADRLNNEAANALLKTLEEPPPFAVLILVAHRPGLLPDTLHSRCQKIGFTPPSVEEIEAWLIQRDGIPAEEATVRVAVCGGNPGEALSLDPEEARGRSERLARLTDPESLRRLPELFALAEEFGRDPETFTSALRYLCHWLRERRRAQALRPDATMDPPPPALSEEAIEALFDLIQKIHSVLHRNLNRLLAMENILLAIRSETVRDPHPASP